MDFGVTIPEKWVRIDAVIGTRMIPEESAKVIERAIWKMREAEEVTEKNLWQCLEYWAADYLSGVE